MIKRSTRVALARTARLVDQTLTRWVTLKHTVEDSRPRSDVAARTPEPSRRFGGLTPKELELAGGTYRALDAEGALFAEPRPISPSERVLPQQSFGARVTDLAWPSVHECKDARLQARYRSTENEVAAVRLFRRGAPRPVAIVIHGYLGGRLALEQHVLPVRPLLDWGFDVAVVTLPFHGLRRTPRERGAPRFPGSDPRLTVEGLVHIVGDLRDLVRYLREQGHPRVGVLGMSLGGYTAALLGTIEPALDFVVPMVPLASLGDFLDEHGHLSPSPALRQLERAALDAVYHAVSPLRRRPLVDARRVLVVGGKEDRITPVSHARRLAHHFGAPLEVWPGGHVFQLGRTRSLARVRSLLRDLAPG